MAIATGDLLVAMPVTVNKASFPKIPLPPTQFG